MCLVDQVDCYVLICRHQSTHDPQHMSRSVPITAVSIGELCGCLQIAITVKLRHVAQVNSRVLAFDCAAIKPVSQLFDSTLRFCFEAKYLPHKKEKKKRKSRLTSQTPAVIARPPQCRTADKEVKVPSAETPNLSTVPSFKMGPKLVRQLVNWCFEPSQPLGIISGLKETFIKKYIVERTNKAEIKWEKQSKKTESCRENVWIKREKQRKKTESCLENLWNEIS